MPILAGTGSEGSVTQLAAWMDLAGSVIEALKAHAFRWNEQEYERFRGGLEESAASLKESSSPSSILVTAGALSQRIEQYHQDTADSVNSTVAELREIIRLLLSSMDQVKVECNESASVLRQVQETIESTSTPEELRISKVHLKLALGKLARQAQDRRSQVTGLIEDLQKRVCHLEQSGHEPAPVSAPAAAGQPPLSAPPAVVQPPPPAPAAAVQTFDSATDLPLDALTGLPNRTAAQTVIQGMPLQQPGVYAAAFYVQRLEQFNARLGDKIGNELLCLAAQRIVNALLRPGDQLFRWRGPAFVALLNREDGLVDVRREVQRVVASRFHFELRGGAMLASIGVDAKVVSVATACSSAEIIQEMEQFFALPGTRAE